MRRSRGLWVAVGLMTAGLGLVVPAIPAQATTSPTVTTYLSSGTIAIASSTGAPLQLLVSATKTDDGSAQTAHVDVSLSSGGWAEEHTWTFPVSPDSLTYDDAQGSGQLVTGKQLGGFGAMRLAFSRETEATDSGCNNTGDTYITGTLAGRLQFDTGTSAWGAVGGKNLSFTSATLRIYGMWCVALAVPCGPGISWTGPDAAPALDGEPGYGGNQIEFRRFGVALADPPGATRMDLLNGLAQRVRLRHGVLHIVADGNRFAGRATIAGGSRTTSSESCGGSTTLKVVHVEGATWSGSTSDPFRTHFQITPDYQPSSAGTLATFDKVTAV